LPNQSSLPAEQGVTAPASVVVGLGYPNGRAEVSPTATGWQASSVNPDGSASQLSATVTHVAIDSGSHLATTATAAQDK
jgi:hypothetical protein